MTQPTPGPWIYKQAAIGEGFAIIAESGAETCIIGEAFKECGEATIAPVLQNARLFASAPDLLAACQEQNKAIDQLFALPIEATPGFLPSKCWRPWGAMQRGRAAIARAKGKPE